MRKHLRRFAVLFALVLATLAFAGCRPAGIEDEDESDGRTRLYISVYKAGFGIDWLDAIAAEYEKVHKDVKVVTKGDANMEGTAQSAIENGGSGVRDIYSLTSSTNYYNNSVYDKDGDGLSDRLACLDNLYEEEIEDGKNLKQLIDPNFENIVKIDGHYYGVPWNAAVTGIMYNTEMFKQKGWRVPTTMEEFYTLCDQISGAGIAPLGYCGNIADGYLYNLFAGLWAQDAGPTKIKEFYRFENPEVYQQESRKRAYQTIGKILGTNKWILKGSAGLDHLGVQQAFIKSECAMIIGGSWLRTEMSEFLKDYPNFQCAMMPLPWINPDKTNPDGTKNGNASDSTVLVVPKDAPHRELAIDFLKFMSTKEMLKLYTEKTGGNPRPFTYEGVDLSGLDTWGESLMNIYLNATNVYSVSYVDNYRLGNLKNILASDGTICDEFKAVGSPEAGIKKGEELWASDYEIAKKYFQ